LRRSKRLSLRRKERRKGCFAGYEGLGSRKT